MMDALALKMRYVTVGGDDRTRILEMGFFNDEDDEGPTIQMSYDDAEPLLLALVSILRPQPPTML
jgi:hypothetical protein